MKLCCMWCLQVYKPRDPTLEIDPNRVFCSLTCYQANLLFEQLVELQHDVYIKKRIRRLK